MTLREALIRQGPSLALQRAALDEIARLDAEIAALRSYVERWRLTEHAGSAPPLAVSSPGPIEHHAV